MLNHPFEQRYPLNQRPGISPGLRRLLTGTALIVVGIVLGSMWVLAL